MGCFSAWHSTLHRASKERGFDLDTAFRPHLEAAMEAATGTGRDLVPQVLAYHGCQHSGFMRHRIHYEIDDRLKRSMKQNYSSY